MTMIKKFFKDESGATAIEYGLLAALISVAGIAAFNTVGGEIKGVFTTTGTALKDAGGTAEEADSGAGS